jgi:uncharacterized phage protein (TIGR01671 family)
MREIRFRAWDGFLDKMLSWKEIEQAGMNLFAVLESQKIIIPMQYTGIKDKNDKEIHEGDVVVFDTIGWFEDKSIKSITGQVVYFNGGFDVHSEGENYCLSLCDNPEIIGNIHDNPELLEERRDSNG